MSKAPVNLSTTNKETSTFIQDAYPSCCPTNSVRALKQKATHFTILLTLSTAGGLPSLFWPKAPGYFGEGWEPLVLWHQYPVTIFPDFLKSRVISSYVPSGLQSNLTHGQLDSRSTRHPVNLSHGQLVTRSMCHAVNSTPSRLVRRSTCHKVNSSPSLLDTWSTRHTVNLSHGSCFAKSQLVILSTHHTPRLSHDAVLMLVK